MKVAVSFIKSKYNEIKTIEKINETDADFLHIDFMDGKFTEEKNYSFNEIYKFLKNNKKPLDVHLMTINPLKYIKDYAYLNTECIIFHLEAVTNVQEVIDTIHSFGIKCGISINPGTPVSKLEPYLNDIEEVLIMSVVPGKGGQKFMPEVLDKITYLKNKKGNYIISIDGGINNETIDLVQDCDMVVSGSFVCMSDDYQNQINILRK
jgi:ribulose-phosphate 3-epimerase